MSALRITDVRWLNPLGAVDDERVSVDIDASGARASTSDAAERTLNGGDLWLLPAMFDLSHHLAPAGRAPQAIAHELQAAWNNGFHAVCAAPDCDPIIDTPSAMEWVMQRAEAGQQPCAQLQLTGALTVDLAGTQLSNMASLVEAGCRAVGQGDGPMPQIDLLRQALRYASDLGLCVHLCPQLNTTFQGYAHDGAVASRLGLDAIPSVSENLAVAMIIALVEDTGCPVHLTRLSTRGAVTRLRQAQAANLPITAGVSIWNLLYTDQAIADYDPRFHLTPPLREEGDRQALLDAIRDGSISVICSDHRPLGQDAKHGPFADTQPGANGIDGFVPALLSLARNEALAPAKLAQCTSAGPAAVMGMSATCDDWLLVDPNRVWTMQAESVHSACRHTPWLEQSIQGAIVARIKGTNCAINQGWQRQLGV